MSRASSFGCCIWTYIARPENICYVPGVLRAIIYRRYSSDEQEKGSTDTLARQLEAGQAFAALKGWAVTDILTDRGRSAYKGEHLLPHADLGKFVAEVSEGRHSGTVLIVERLDRLSRRPVDEAMAFIHSLTQAGVSIGVADTGEVFAARPDMATFLATAIRAALSYEESRKKSDNTLKAKSKLWQMAQDRTGAWTKLANRHPSWLRRNERADGWVIDEERADVVRLIFELAAEGNGYVRIVQHLNARGIAPFDKAKRYTSGKHEWGRSSVRQIIASPSVEGDWAPKEGVYAGRVIPDFYPRIVGADLVRRARAAAEGRRKEPGRVKGSSRPLFSMTCGQCRRAAFTYSTVKKGRLYIYARCASAADGRCDNAGSWRYDIFEETALDWLLDLALDDRFFVGAGELRKALDRVAELEKALGDARAARQRLITLFADGDDQLAEEVVERKQAIELIEADLTTAKAELATASGRVNDAEHLRRVEDVRAVATGPEGRERNEARGRLKSALGAIVMNVSIDVVDGNRCFTVYLVKGTAGIRINTRGEVMNVVDSAMRGPLYTYLSAEEQESIAPLIRRLEAFAGPHAQKSEPTVGT